MRDHPNVQKHKKQQISLQPRIYPKTIIRKLPYNHHRRQLQRRNSVGHQIIYKQTQYQLKSYKTDSQPRPTNSVTKHI